MREVEEAKAAFEAAVGHRSDLPGINEVNLAAAACALIKAERADPGCAETASMRASFRALGRPDVYHRVMAVVGQP